MSDQHPLRDLAARVEALAKRHPAYSQSHKVVQNCCDHLCAIARTHEANAEIERCREQALKVSIRAKE